MMSEMIERVAAAIFKHETGFDEWDGPLLSERGRNMWRGYARAAIEAMREPTYDMVVYGSSNLGDLDVEFAGLNETLRGAKECWGFMIDEALK
jgi:hypothetical protein